MRTIHKYIVSFVLLLFLYACATVPVTGRRQLNLIPESSLINTSFNQYNQFLANNEIAPASDPQTQMVKDVGQDIAEAVEEYLRKQGKGSRVENFKWEFNLVEDASANAWAMPGGKVVVNTGILPIAENRAGLAVILGHEVAHAIARHGNERMSQALLVQLGGVTLDVALDEKPEMTQQIFLQSYGVASTLGMLKYSRTHESEADKLGLIFMAMAGYNPENAVQFWERMEAKSKGPQVPEFLSTHPSHDERIKDIKKYLPKAMKYYRPEEVQAK